MPSSPIDERRILPNLNTAEWHDQATVGAWRLRGRIRDRLGLYFHGAWENPSWILIFTLGRFLLVRRLLAMISRRTTPMDASRSILFDGLAVDDVVEAVRDEGIYCGLRLPEQSLAEIRAFAQDHVCYGAFERRFAFLARHHAQAEEVYGRRFLVGHFLDEIERCQAIGALQNDPILKEIATRYLRTDPVPISTRLWWSFPSAMALDSELRQAAQDRLHTDINDWRSVKFFFYLTDVDLEAGAHIFFLRTHRQRLLRHQFSLFTGHTREALVRGYGETALMTVCGEAGFGFAEDPFAFHSGTVVQRTPRLILQIEFGVTRFSRARFYGG
ncbi:MAG TPA: hypothetical protein VNS33_12720 [Bradyrhizobium sp.]|nr:hypothetical protein [Bradyrhizobium sp.]